MRYIETGNKHTMAIIKKIFALLLLGFATGVSAQSEKVKNLPYIDQRRIHFGFMLGMHTQDITFTHSGAITTNGENWYAEIPSFSPGFAVGLVSDLAFTESLNLRFTPSMYFGNKNVTFKDANTGEKIKQDIKSNYLNLPVNMRYSSQRVNNYRPYIMAGINPSIDLSKRKETPLVLKRFDLAIEIGIGCDLYLPFFKLIPELKFSFGLLDIIEHTRKDLKDPEIIKYTEALDKGKSRIVTLSFYFE